MNRYTRRKFLKTIGLGVGGLLVSSSILKASSLSSSNNKEDKKTLLQENAHENFYRRQYDKAEILYKQYINLYPQDIVGYDGLAKVYGAKQKQLEIVELYQSALQLNSLNPIFYDRLARAMNALSLGNRKQEQAFVSTSGKTFLLASSALLYLQAIEIDHTKKYLYEGLLDTKHCLEKKNAQLSKTGQPTLEFSNDLSSKIATVTKNYENIWKQTRTQQSNKGKITNNLSQSLGKIKEKKRRILYFDDEKRCREKSISKKKNEFIYPFLVQSIKENKIENAEEYFNQIDDSVYKDTYSQFLLTKLYKKNQAYAKLINLRKKEESDSLWSKLNLAQSYALDGIKNKNTTQLNLALNFYQQAIQYEEYTTRNTKAIGALYKGIAICYFGKKESEQGRNILQTGLKLLPPTSGVALSLLIEYAESYAQQNSINEAEEILLHLSGENTSIVIQNNEFVETYIKERESQIEWEQKNNVEEWRKELKKARQLRKIKQRKIVNQQLPTPDKLKASYALANIYKKKKLNNKFGNVLRYIEKENPGNAFVSKRRRTI